MLSALRARTPSLLRSATSAPRVLAPVSRGLKVKQGGEQPQQQQQQQQSSDVQVQQGQGSGAVQKRQQRGELMPPSMRRFGDVLSQVQREMDMMMGSLFGEGMLRPFALDRGLGALATPMAELIEYTPMLPVDVQETDKAYLISAEVPGFSKDHIKCTLSPEGILTIQGEQKEEEKKGKRGVSRYTSFTRSFRLPNNVHMEGINASVKNGVLTVEVPKAEKPEAQPKEIPIAE